MKSRLVSDVGFFVVLDHESSWFQVFDEMDDAQRRADELNQLLSTDRYYAAPIPVED